MSSEGGPCYVTPDGMNTTLNPWSLNNHANVLYIDQPVGAGFSYTSLVNGTYDLFKSTITPLKAYNGTVPESNLIVSQGTFSDPTTWAVTNTSISTAKALWHFAEHWLTQFPEYKSSNKNIGIWGNSVSTTCCTPCYCLHKLVGWFLGSGQRSTFPQEYQGR